MNKEDFHNILQIAMFTYEGETEEDIKNYNIYSESLIQIGRRLCFYLNPELKEDPNHETK